MGKNTSKNKKKKTTAAAGTGHKLRLPFVAGLAKWAPAFSLTTGISVSSLSSVCLHNWHIPPYNNNNNNDN